MSENPEKKCCRSKSKEECCSSEQKDFFGNWFKKADENKEITFTLSEVISLLEEVKNFNAGAVDRWLDRHVNQILSEKLKNKLS